jgi:hypothetical protein
VIPDDRIAGRSIMTNFYGYEIELFAIDVLTEVPGASVRSGVDLHGERWLIVLVDEDPGHLVWMCAPVSSRALFEVAAGRAAVRDVLRHTVTGTVEVVTTIRGRAVPDRCLLCSDIPPALLPLDDSHLATAA